MKIPLKYVRNGASFILPGAIFRMGDDRKSECLASEGEPFSKGGRYIIPPARFVAVESDAAIIPSKLERALHEAELRAAKETSKP